MWHSNLCCSLQYVYNSPRNEWIAVTCGSALVYLVPYPFIKSGRKSVFNEKYAIHTPQQHQACLGVLNKWEHMYEANKLTGGITMTPVSLSQQLLCEWLHTAWQIRMPLRLIPPSKCVQRSMAVYGKHTMYAISAILGQIDRSVPVVN